jgi:hypothetical protein
LHRVPAFCNIVDVLTLDCGAVTARIDERFDGNLAAVSRNWPVGDPPHRSTILRWLRQETLPRSAHELLSFCGALDLDPFSLWGVAPATFPALCARLVKASRAGSWAGLLPALSFVGPTPEWPPATLARDYFHRDWSIREFRHPAHERRNYFAPISIDPQAAQNGGIDRVWHFAWRDDIDHALWRPYGFVRLAGADLRLFSFNGLTDSQKVDTPGSGFTVETWFGEGSAAFRVASLHPFGLKLAEADDTNVARVRFGFP